MHSELPFVITLSNATQFHYLRGECYHLNTNSYALLTFSNLNINTRVDNFIVKRKVLSQWVKTIYNQEGI